MHDADEFIVVDKPSNSPWFVLAFLILAVFAVGVVGTYEYKKHTAVPVPVASVETIIPCFRVTMMYAGKGYIHTKNGQAVSHCLPCEKAKSVNEKLVCDGDAN